MSNSSLHSLMIVKLNTGQYIIGLDLPDSFIPCLTFSNYNTFFDFITLCITAISDEPAPVNRKPSTPLNDKLLKEIEEILSKDVDNNK